MVAGIVRSGETFAVTIDPAEVGGGSMKIEPRNYVLWRARIGHEPTDDADSKKKGSYIYVGELRMWEDSYTPNTDYWEKVQIE